MAELPSCWDLLTASIGVSDLRKPNLIWAFLVLQGLVRDEPGDREFFLQATAELLADPITGDSTARRLARRLAHAGITLDASGDMDPWGKLAATRLAQIETWTDRSEAREYLARSTHNS